jgi:hypothetical protein
LLEKAAPVPAQQAVAEKKILELVVQLMKRRRDLYYAYDPDLAPISVVLTTLAADVYCGEPSVSKALTSALSAIVKRVEDSRLRGEKHLQVRNPSNAGEDLTERWDSNQSAYEAFVKGIHDFHQRWSRLIAQAGDVNAELELLFGEPVARVLKTRATRLQEFRIAGKLGITSSGIIASAGAGAVSMRPNTFYGAE